MKLVHAADIHLGCRRLEGRLPDEDFAQAFAFIATQAIAESADALLIAGDLFDRPQVEPPLLQQAMAVLRRLKSAGIPIVTIEGNHDRAFVHTDTPTWVNYLGQEDLLIHLRPRFDPAGAILEPWNTTTKSGAWIDLKGVRFTGAGYLGAATPSKLRQIVAALEKGPCHVLLLHAGPDYFVGEGGGYSVEDLRAARAAIRYLALGHIHKPFLVEDWACNPGSPENCDVREAGYGHGPKDGPRVRGYAVVTIDPAQPAIPPTIEIRDTPRRPCHRVDVDCTSFGNKTKNGAATLVAAASKAIKATGAGANAVVDLRLRGALNLNRISIDQVTASEQIRVDSGVFAVSLDLSGLNIEGFKVAGQADANAGATREEIEKLAIRRLVGEEPLWGLTDEQDGFSTLFYDLKEQVRTGRSDQEIAETISQSPLVDRVRAARLAPPATPKVEAMTP